MTRRTKSILITVGVLGVLAVCFVIFIGPWPTYKSGFENKAYYTNALSAIDRQAKLIVDGPPVGRFHAAWSSRSITPPIGTPMAGYGARKGRGSTGVHDEIYVKALAVSDGSDLAVIVGCDLLIVPENVADVVRTQVAERTSLAAKDIFFNASHSHSGPGAFAPGLASRLFNGPYDPKIASFLTEAFTEAIVEATARLEPAKLAHGGIDAPQYIKNRTRETAPVDSELSYLLVEQDDGDRCFVVSYSAHPTVLSPDNMQFSGEYPGFLMQWLTQETVADAIYLGGAVGSMTHRAPDANDPFARCRALGTALADLVLEATEQPLEFADQVDVASIGTAIQLPPFQVRLSENWRVSKFLPPLLGVDADGWIHAVRVGDVILVGTPADYCGEISIKLKAWGRQQFGDLWVLGFNGDYVGYVSPDEYYYDKEEGGGYGYERGLMSWIGPDQEALTVALIKHMVQALFAEPSGGGKTAKLF